MCVYAYVVMPEHVHLLLNEPAQGTLAEAIHFLKLSFSKRVRSLEPRSASKERTRTWGTLGTLAALPTFEKSATGSFWEKRYYDRNVRDEDEFRVKLRYVHRNPIKRGLVQDPQDWEWRSFRHYALQETGIVEIESEWTARDRENGSTGRRSVFFDSECFEIRPVAHSSPLLA
jgi:putative transposase